MALYYTVFPVLYHNAMQSYTFPMTFYSILEQIRTDRGLKQAEFLRMIRTPRSTYKHWKDNPGALPQLRKIEDIEERLGVTFERYGRTREVSGWHEGGTSSPAVETAPARLGQSVRELFQTLRLSDLSWEAIPEKLRTRLELEWTLVRVELDRLTIDYRQAVDGRIKEFERRIASMLLEEEGR